MITSVKTLVTSAVVALLALVPMVAIASTAGAQVGSDISTPSVGGSLEQGTCLSTNDCSTAPTATEDTVNSTVALVINIFSWIVGVVSVIMIIWGGFKYITSGGDSSNVTAAKNTILYAIIGLIIVALAQVIVRFVLGTASGTGL